MPLLACFHGRLPQPGFAPNVVLPFGPANMPESEKDGPIGQGLDNSSNSSDLGIVYDPDAGLTDEERQKVVSVECF